MGPQFVVTQEPAGVGAEGLARRRTGRWLVTALSSVLVITAAGLVAGFVAGSRRHRPGHHQPLGPLLAVLAGVTLTLAVLGLLLWKLLSRPRYQRVMQYEWRRRMRVAKALRRGEPIEPGDVAVADALVEQMRSQKFIFWFQPVMIALWILNAIIHHGLVRWLYVGLALVTGPALLYSIRTQRRTIRTWEARSMQPDADASGGVVGA